MAVSIIEINFASILQALFRVFFDPLCDPTAEETCAEFKAALGAAVREYMQTDDESFVRKIRLGKDLADVGGLKYVRYTVSYPRTNI